MDWITPQQLAALRVPGVPGTDRGVRLWLEKNLVASRTKVRGKGYEIHIPSLPQVVREIVVAQWLLRGGSNTAGTTHENIPATQSNIILLRSNPLRGDHPARGTLPAAGGVPAGERAGRLPAALERGARGDRAAAADSALSDAATQVAQARESLWNWLASRPESIQAEGRRRSAICLKVRHLLDAGLRKGAAIAQVAQAESVPAPTLTRWWYGDVRLPGVDRAHPGDYAPLLAPRYSGREAHAEISPDAWLFIKADWLRAEQPSASACYRRLQQVAANHGWLVPSLKTVERRLEALPWQLVALCREGKDALLRRLPHVTRTRGHLAPLEAVNADGHYFDVMVRLPTGETGRPVLVAWQDLFSGQVLSWRLGMTLNQHLVRLSFGDMIDSYGVPSHAYLDNGREFANKWLTGGSDFRYRFTVREDDPIGLFGLLGTEAHWTTPYHGQSKPIERAWRDLCEGVSRHPKCSGAYTGSNTVSKPHNYGDRVLDWADFHAIVADGIREHNARTGRRTETARGRSFDETFNAAFAQAVIRRPTTEQRRLWLLAVEGIKVRQSGHVAIGGNLYWCDALPGFIGQKVAARFDPEHLERPVAVYSLSGELIGEAERTVARFDDAETAKTHNRNNKRRLKAAQALREAELQMSVAEAAAMLPSVGDAPTPAPGAVRLMPEPRRMAQGEALQATGTGDYVSAADAVVREWMRPRERLRVVDE